MPCYFESNGKKTPGTYAEVRFGGDGGGIVRDCIVQGAHIGVPENGNWSKNTRHSKEVTSGFCWYLSSWLPPCLYYNIVELLQA